MTLDPKALEAAREAYMAHFPDAEGVTLDGMEAAITAYLASSTAPVSAAGWKMVPVEATAENGMKYALIGEVKISYHRDVASYDAGHDEATLGWPAIKRIYKQLLSASPSPPRTE